MIALSSANLSRRQLIGCLILSLAALFPSLKGSAPTRGMSRRQDRRGDRTERIQERDDRMVERQDDPVGIRGPQRRSDRRDLRTDRRTDRQERIY